MSTCFSNETRIIRHQIIAIGIITIKNSALEKII